MSLYKYKFVKAGEEREETREFPDKVSLYNSLRANGSSVLSVEEVKSAKAGFHFSFRKKISSAELINFAKNLSVMIDAGLSVSRALAVMQKQSKNKHFIAVMEQISTSISSGETFSKSLESRPDIFSSLFVSMVKAGEESGKLAYSLKIISEQLEKSYILAKKIKGAMIYPSVIICVMIVIGIVLMVYMVPTLTETFKGLNIKLPLPTRVIIAISDFLRTNFILTILALVGSVFGVLFGLKTKFGRDTLDTIVLHTPMIKTISKEINAARTARTLSSLISSGVGIVSALEITGAVLQNHYFRDLLATASKQVEVGELLSLSLSSEKTDLYPVFVGEMLSVGEETGKMTDMLANIAVYYESEVDQKTKDLSTVIEPFLMVIIGVAVGLFAIAMMLPTYSLVDAIQ